MSDEEFPDEPNTPLLPRFIPKRGVVMMSNVPGVSNSESDATNDDLTEVGSKQSSPKGKHKEQKRRAAKKEDKERAKKGEGDEIRCFQCGGSGHLKRYCPSKPRKGDNRGHGSMKQADLKNAFDKMEGDSEARRMTKEELDDLKADKKAEKKQADNDLTDAKAELLSIKEEFEATRGRVKMLGKEWNDRRFISVDFLPYVAGFVALFVYSCFVDVQFFQVHVGDYVFPFVWFSMFSYRRLVLSTLIGLLFAAYLYSTPWRNFRAIVVRLAPTDAVARDFLDLRYDANALLDLKHRDPLWARVHFSLYVGGILWPWYKHERWVSIEKCVQAMHPSNQELDVDDETMLRRIKASVRTIHAVGDDRYKALVSATSFDAVALVYTAFRDYQYQRRFYLAGGLHAPFTHPKDLPRY